MDSIKLAHTWSTATLVKEYQARGGQQTFTRHSNRKVVLGALKALVQTQEAAAKAKAEAAPVA